MAYVIDYNAHELLETDTYYIRSFTKFGIKVYIAKLRQPAGQTQDNFNFGPSLLKF